MSINTTTTATLAALATFALSPVALALQAETADTTETEADERIQVTGSQIKGVDLEGAQPLTVIDAEEIANSPADTISDLLKYVAQTRGGSGSFNTSSSGALQGDSPVGQAAASLRGLGASSTLTLVNGRRISASSFANNFENFVDINSIPLAAIERIEILANGASATYGADAIAGVINYILKKDYEGFEINAGYGNSQASSSDDKVNLNLVGGTNIGDTNVTAYLDYYKRNALYDRDREQTATSFFPSQQGIYPSFNTLFFDDIDYVEQSCPDNLRYDGREGFPTSSFGEYCEYNQNAVVPTYADLEQLGAGLNLNTQVGTMNWFTEIMWGQTKSTSNSTGAPFSGFEVAYDHPDFPDELKARYDALYDDLGFAPDDRILTWGRFADGRTISNQTTAYRIVTGLNGYVGAWDWEAAISYSRSESEQRAEAGIINEDKFQAALLGELCADGSLGCSPSEGGIWFNPFDGQTGNEQVLGLIEERVPRNGESTLLGLDFKMSGELFDVDAGIVSAAWGAEFRREEITDTPDPIARGTFENNYDPGVIGFGSTGASAERDQWAVFGELFVPITEKLDLQLAGRYDHYDDFGGDFNPKATFRYTATDDLILRASFAESFRAPSLSQVGAEVTLSSFVLDCKPEFIGNYCFEGDVDNTFLTKVFGNENLEAEEAKSYNAGFAWSASRDITLTVDYWRFEHDNIVGVDGEFLLLRSLTDPDLRKCGELPATLNEGIGFEECDNGVGVIDSRIAGDIHLQLQNLGKQETDGLDVTYTHYFDMNDMGSLRWTVDATHLFSFERQLSQEADIEELAGDWRYPDTIITSRLRWSGDDWFGGVSAQYTSAYNDNIEGLNQSELDRLGISANRQVPSWTKVNAHVGYDVSRDLTLRLSIENLFDREAPTAFGTSANVDHYNHDTMGRFYRLSATYRF
ncbi:TonB-dependent receptor [Pseudidiomarina aestuarii]|uniref:TonB-dependent receptor n=1 Tax=Pseudidiomarina aestuarii TaxID=624146 RepID=A0A7Z7ESV7_9GAMM|nr:TonB-dependent receptor [Pseudidiomarina aestuarii]RUO39417.1 TonB-dependent receptor [Pseudidiomarina aestuarii]